jgi:hypothetical protein
MTGRLFRPSDPFEGVAAHRTHVRVRLESGVAFALAITACGLATSMWIRLLVPMLEQRLGL